MPIGKAGGLGKVGGLGKTKTQSKTGGLGKKKGGLGGSGLGGKGGLTGAEGLGVKEGGLGSKANGALASTRKYEPKLTVQPYQMMEWDKTKNAPVAYDYSKGKRGKAAVMGVESSNIADMQYDDAHLLMYVTFNSGAKYMYEGVPRDVYEKILNAPSKGIAFWDYVRVRGTVYGTQYEYRKI